MNTDRVQFIRCAYRRAEFPVDDRPEIVFLGRSNVGKSSAINSLLNRSSLARTSSTPGRTRGIGFYLVDEAFYFVDLPGYGYAKVPERVRRSWKDLIEAYLADRPQLILGLLIVDARHEPKPLDLQMRDWLLSAHVPYLVLLTKADKLPRHQLMRSVQRARPVFSPAEVIPFSARTGLGVKQVWRVIRARLAHGRNHS
ncbi:MAG: YihA family ribosome biogenesis GTP-binding protein [Acidobacteria bacterium]|nr:MAG: YihA family ribosome biogenesis GTP-binding protein [Acidobacteriota bacterium]